MNFKKLTVILATGALCASLLCGCGDSTASTSSTSGNDAGTTTTTTTSDTESQESFTYTLNGVALNANAEWAPLQEKLGDPDNYFESDSCAFQGKDKVYTYGSVNVTTYPMEDVDYINIIELKDDTVSTDEGICIGSSKDAVTEAYGEADKSTDNSVTYVKGDCELSFMFENDAVSAITYTAITE